MPERTYDVGIADPTRVGRLPRGTPYFQQGDAAQRMQNKKYHKYNGDLSQFGPLTRRVKFIPLIFETTGSMGPLAAEQFRIWCKEASENVRSTGGRNYRALDRDHTWNAMKFANLYAQLLSFSIVRDTALSVMKAIVKAAKIRNVG